MKKPIVLNERKYAEKCLSEQRTITNPFFDLTIIARYYYDIGLKKGKIRQLLSEYLEKYYPPYFVSKSKWQETIDRIVKNVQKYKLYQIDGIWITQKELDTITDLHDLVLEKLAFTSLCFAKLNATKYPDNEGWVNNDAKELFSIARVSDIASNRYLRLGKLKEKGLIRPSMKMAELSFQVLFLDKEGEGKLYVSESDFRELGYKWLQYKGENIIECAECGKLTRGNKNGTKKYCHNCVAYRPQESKTIYCVDCGKEVQINSRNWKTIRCTECQKNKDKERKRIWIMNQRKM